MINELIVTEKGIVAPTTQEVYDGLWGLMKSIFGEELTVKDSTPQGQLVTTLTAIITDKNNQIIQLANQFDPRYANGVYQDALAYIYFLSRKQATKSTVTLTFNGLAGTAIPKGYRVIDTSKNVWETTNANAIGSNGFATVNAECMTAGAFYASSNTITKLGSVIVGLDNVTNETAAIAGKATETRQDFELRRSQSVAINSKNTNQGTYGAVAGLNDVIDCYVIDNPTDATIYYGITKYPMIRNSIAVSVVGGDDEQIAKQILTKAGSGCSFVGNTTVIYKDTDSWNIDPPEYEIKFIRPSFIPIEINLVFENVNLLTLQEKNAINDIVLETVFKGENKARIAGLLLASNLVCPVSSVVNSTRLVSIKIARVNGEPADIIKFGIDEYPSLDEGNIKVDGWKE